MNKYSYVKENQDAFGAWFDTIPASVKAQYLARLVANDHGNWIYFVLENGGQALQWVDAFIDCLYDSEEVKSSKNEIEEIYLQEEFYNPRCKATVSAAWIVVYEDGSSFPVCGKYSAANEQDVRNILRQRG